MSFLLACLPDPPRGFVYVVAGLDYIIDESGAFVIVERIIVNNLALDGAYGSDNVTRKYPVAGQQSVTLGGNTSIMFAGPQTFETNEITILTLKKPDGSTLDLPATTGRHEVPCAIGVLMPLGYVQASLSSAMLDQAGLWQAWINGDSGKSNAVSFRVVQG